MSTIQIPPFQIIGISIRTTNHMSQAVTDIGALWQKFLSENILSKIPNKISNDIYSVYTEYAGDHTQPYTTLLGCPVSTLIDIPIDLVGMSFAGGHYAKFMAKGNLHEGVVVKAWENIWHSVSDRAYTTDFEIFSERASNALDAEVDIYVAINRSLPE